MNPNVLMIGGILAAIYAMGLGMSDSMDGFYAGIMASLVLQTMAWASELP